MTDVPRAEVTIGIDLGGTNMSAALVSRSGEILQHRTEPRPNTAAGMDWAPVELASSMISGSVGAIGLGVAGLVRADQGVLEWGPNVEGRRIGFRDLFERELGLPAAVDNDANVAALAETRLGAGVGYRHVAMITLGTGIGGGWIINAELYRGRAFAGEIGHMVIDVGGPMCTCGQRGCWEIFASGRRLDQAARDLVALKPGGTVAKLAADSPPTGRHLTDAALEGDRDAIDAISEMAVWLGVGIANIVAALDPEVVVIGGGVSRAGELLLEPTRRSFEESLAGADHRDPTPIVAATLGEKAGVVGAGLLAWEECL